MTCTVYTYEHASMGDASIQSAVGALEDEYTQQLLSNRAQLGLCVGHWYGQYKV